MAKDKITLKGSLDPGYQKLLERQGAEPPPPAEILNDPTLLAAQAVNAGIQDLPVQDFNEDPEGETEVGQDPEGVTLKGSFAPPDPYDREAVWDVDDQLGNGSTIPFKYRGRPTQAFTTCSEPIPNMNRGCPLFFRCPVRGLGPGTIAFQDQKTKQIRADVCINLLMSGIIANTRRYHLLPGVNFHVSYDVKWAPFPDGSRVKAGPGEEKTELVRTIVKNPLVMPFDSDIIRQYEVLRRRGEAA